MEETLAEKEQVLKTPALYSLTPRLPLVPLLTRDAYLTKYKFVFDRLNWEEMFNCGDFVNFTSFFNRLVLINFD